jgi:hypothetical protein
MWKLPETTDPLKLKSLIVREAHGVLDGGADLLDASCKIYSYMSRLGFDRGDPDFNVFAGIETEIDHLPIGAERENWASDALDRKEQEVQAARAWAESVGGLEACRSVISSFSILRPEPNEAASEPQGLDS